MKNLFVIILFIGCFTIIGCKKESLLTELEANKWENDVPNYIVVDSSSVGPAANTSYRTVKFYLSFNENFIEQEWNTIKSIHVKIQETKFQYQPISDKTISVINGTAVYSDSNIFRYSSYNFQFYIEFDNGRTTLLSPIYPIVT